MKQDDKTLEYYDQNVDTFIAGTITADMNDIYRRFLSQLPPRAYILDFGCGSGRDTKFFLEHGYSVDATDGSAELCRKASEYAGIPVKHMLFQDLESKEQFDGIWACASILHLPKGELTDVLRKIAAALKVGGILYTGFKYGTYEGMRNGRYFTDFTEQSLSDYWRSFPEMPIFEQWVTQDVRPGREEERWINFLARRISL